MEQKNITIAMTLIFMTSLITQAAAIDTLFVKSASKLTAKAKALVSPYFGMEEFAFARVSALA